MRPTFWFGLAVCVVASVAVPQPVTADPPTLPDVGKWTDSQKLDDILERMRMLDGSMKELLGLRDRVVMLEDRIKKLESDLNVLLNQVPTNQMNVQDQIRKLRQDLEAMRNGSAPPTPETRLKPPGPDGDLEGRMRKVEDSLLQITGMLGELRRGTVVPLPAAPTDTTVFKPGTRRVYIVNKTQTAQVVLIDGMPFSVEPNDPTSPALFATPNETTTFEAPSTKQPLKTIQLKDNEYYVFTLK